MRPSRLRTARFFGENFPESNRDSTIAVLTVVRRRARLSVRETTTFVARDRQTGLSAVAEKLGNYIRVEPECRYIRRYITV